MKNSSSVLLVFIGGLAVVFGALFAKKIIDEIMEPDEDDLVDFDSLYYNYRNDDDHGIEYYAMS